MRKEEEKVGKGRKGREGKDTETLSQNLEIRKGDNGAQLSCVGVPALGIERVVLDEIDVDEFVEGEGDVFGDVEGCDEGVAKTERKEKEKLAAGDLKRSYGSGG